MNPKEKAKELVERMNQPYCIGGNYNMTQWQIKQCAIICVEEIIAALQKNSNGLIYSDNPAIFDTIAHYQQVKKEIELL